MPERRPTGDRGGPSAVRPTPPAGSSTGITADAGADARSGDAPQGPLEQEIAFYLQHLHEWGAHEGKHVLIHEQPPYGFYPTRDEALLEGFRRFGRVSFLVKQVLLLERPRPLVGVIL